MPNKRRLLEQKGKELQKASEGTVPIRNFLPPAANNERQKKTSRLIRMSMSTNWMKPSTKQRSEGRPGNRRLKLMLIWNWKVLQLTIKVTLIAKVRVEVKRIILLRTVLI